MEKRSAAIFTDTTVAPETRTAQRAALMQEANAKVVAALGEKGAAIYKQNGGFWIESLKPRPNPSGNGATPPSAVPAVRLPGGD